MTLVAALLPAMLGLALIQHVATRRIRWRVQALVAGWASVAAGVAGVIVAAGAEHGVPIALGIVGPIAWVLIAGGSVRRDRSGYSAPRRPGRRALPLRAPQPRPDAPTLVRHTATLGRVILVAGGTAALASVAVARLLFPEAGSRAGTNAALAFVIVAFPIVWGVLAAAVFVVERHVRLLVGLLVTALALLALQVPHEVGDLRVIHALAVVVVTPAIPAARNPSARPARNLP